jgi:cellulose synthase/poly-beta-1,6-N-acetylglucosamine synthase-like glycosyltransferase
VDVYVVCYSEPLAVIEPTVVAALNLSWPGRLAVYVCDDGRNAAVRDFCDALAEDMRVVFRAGAGRSVHYVARDKVKGVPHHAKVGLLFFGCCCCGCCACGDVASAHVMVTKH